VSASTRSNVAEVATVVSLFAPTLKANGLLSSFQSRVLGSVSKCRTAALGGHVDACTDCGVLHISYNSCRNRHCPKCQGLERETWVLSREEELLPVRYYHVVFTIPAALNGFCLHNPRFMYDCLFEASWATLQQFSKDKRWLGGTTGATMVLHTWGQNLSLHPHVHAIVPGGGLSKDGVWLPVKSRSERFLYPVKAMSKVFRAIFLKKMCSYLAQGLLTIPQADEGLLDPQLYRSWRDKMYRTDWVVYAKQPFGGPKSVLEYLGRYTHKSAISNHRIVYVSETDGVCFKYKDYRTNGETKEMLLSGEEFLRRWVLHILPEGFRRMRHYGIVSNALKNKALEACRISLGVIQEVKELAKQSRNERRKALRAKARERLSGGKSPDTCPCCGGHLVRVGVVPPQERPPPDTLPNWIAITD
jgi:hypothetical protein